MQHYTVPAKSTPQDAHNLTALLETLSMSGILHAETHVALRKCGWTNTRSSTLLQDRLREDRTMESKWASQEGVCETVLLTTAWRLVSLRVSITAMIL